MERRRYRAVVSPVLRPPPEPLEVDAVRVVAVATGGWLVLLLGLLPFAGRLADSGDLIWVQTAVVGLLLGLLGLRVCVLRRRRLRARR